MPPLRVSWARCCASRGSHLAPRTRRAQRAGHRHRQRTAAPEEAPGLRAGERHQRDTREGRARRTGNHGEASRDRAHPSAASAQPAIPRPLQRPCVRAKLPLEPSKRCAQETQDCTHLVARAQGPAASTRTTRTTTPLEQPGLRGEEPEGETRRGTTRRRCCCWPQAWAWARQPKRGKPGRGRRESVAFLMWRSTYGRGEHEKRLVALGGACTPCDATGLGWPSTTIGSCVQHQLLCPPSWLRWASDVLEGSRAGRRLHDRDAQRAQ